MPKLSTQAVNLIEAYEKGSDITTSEKRILNDIASKTRFQARENIWRSKYWGKNLGASHWLGKLNGISVVLKIQGTKPSISEAFIIQNFESSNRSDLIRPPKLLYVIPWRDENGYEALFMEHVTGGKVLADQRLQTRENISTLFWYYNEYRENCIPEKSWVSKPSEKNWAKESFDSLTYASLKAYPSHPFRDPSDFDLARYAFEILDKAYKNEDLEFMHGHFSCNDIKYENKNSKNAVLFSNLFWKWRYPYYDAVFAYHWFMYELQHVKGITSEKVEKQRNIWLEEIYKATGAIKSEKIKKLVNAALLERAISGLIIDSFLVDPKKAIARYLTDSTRNEVIRLGKILES